MNDNTVYEVIKDFVSEHGSNYMACTVQITSGISSLLESFFRHIEPEDAKKLSSAAKESGQSFLFHATVSSIVSQILNADKNQLHGKDGEPDIWNVGEFIGGNIALNINADMLSKANIKMM